MFFLSSYLLLIVTLFLLLSGPAVSSEAVNPDLALTPIFVPHSGQIKLLIQRLYFTRYATSYSVQDLTLTI